MSVNQGVLLDAQTCNLAFRDILTESGLSHPDLLKPAEQALPNQQLHALHPYLKCQVPVSFTTT